MKNGVEVSRQESRSLRAQAKSIGLWIPLALSPPQMYQTFFPRSFAKSRITGLSIGSTEKKCTTAGMRSRCIRRRSYSSWFSADVPSQTLGQPPPQFSGNILAIFCGRFVSSCQSKFGVLAISFQRSARHCVGTALSNTSDKDAQNSRRRTPSAFAPRSNLIGSRHRLVRRRSPSGPQPLTHLRRLFCTRA